MFSHGPYTLVDFIPVSDQGHSDVFEIIVFETSYMSQIFVACSIEVSGILPHVDAAQPLADCV